MVAEAKKWIGYLEHKTQDFIGVYDANVGKGYCTVFAELVRRAYPWRSYMGVPWCAVFVHAVAIQALGIKQARKLLGKPCAGTRLLARRMLLRGRYRGNKHTPSPGDIIFLHNGDGRISHCGIVTSVDESTITSIEGNTIDPSGRFAPHQGGAVAQRTRCIADASIVGYGDLSHLESMKYE